MLDKLQALEDRYLDLEAKISDPEVIADQTNWLKATKAHAKLEPIVTAYREYRDMIKARDEAEELLAAGSRFFCCLPTRTMTKTLSWKSAAVPAVMRLHFLPVFSSVCISAMQKPAAGALRLWIPTRLSWVVSKK